MNKNNFIIVNSLPVSRDIVSLPETIWGDEKVYLPDGIYRSI